MYNQGLREQISALKCQQKEQEAVLKSVIPDQTKLDKLQDHLDVCRKGEACQFNMWYVCVYVCDSIFV